MLKSLPVLLQHRTADRARDQICLAPLRPKQRDARTSACPIEEERFREIENVYLSGMLSGMMRGQETRH